MHYLRRGSGPTVRIFIVLVMVAVALSTQPSSADTPARPTVSPPNPADFDVEVLHGPLFLLTDSVGLGAIEEIGAATRQPFEHLGYPGMTAAVAVEFMRSRTAPLGDTVVVALGYNYPHWDPKSFDDNLDQLVHRLGELGASNIVMVNLRRADKSNSPARSWGQVDRVAWYFPQVNRHIEAAVDRHPAVSVADWAAVSAGPGLTYDAIHLNPAGQKLMADTVIDEVRRAQRRTGAGTHAFEWPTTDSVDAGSPSGVVVSVDVADMRSSGKVTVHGCQDDSARTSTARIGRQGTTTLLAAVSLGRNGRVCVTTTDAATLVVRAVAELTAGGGLLVGRGGGIEGYKIADDPAAATSPVRLTKAITVADTNLRAGKSHRLKVEARGRLPLFRVEVSARVAGTLTMHECANPKRRIPIARYPANNTEALTLIGYAQNKTCVSASTRAAVVVRQIGTVKDTAITMVRPRTLWSPTAR